MRSTVRGRESREIMGRFAKKQKTSLEILKVEYRPVDLALAATVVSNGHSLRITIPHKQVMAFDIQAGDEVMIRITGVKRERGRYFSEESQHAK